MRPIGSMRFKHTKLGFAVLASGFLAAGVSSVAFGAAHAAPALPERQFSLMRVPATVTSPSLLRVSPRAALMVETGDEVAVRHNHPVALHPVPHITEAARR